MELVARNAGSIQAGRGGLGLLNWLGDRLLWMAHLARCVSVGLRDLDGCLSAPNRSIEWAQRQWTSQARGCGARCGCPRFGVQAIELRRWTHGSAWMLACMAVQCTYKHHPGCLPAAAPGHGAADEVVQCRPNTVAGSRRNIEAHYDAGNDMYRLFLDDTMTYSCALYRQPGARDQVPAAPASDRGCCE